MRAHFAQDGERIGAGVAGVDLDGQSQLVRKQDLPHKERTLGRPVISFIVVIEADLPHRGAIFQRGKRAEPGFIEGLPRIFRMHPDSKRAYHVRRG